jgi:hypothetical protein
MQYYGIMTGIFIDHHRTYSIVRPPGGSQHDRSVEFVVVIGRQPQVRFFFSTYRRPYRTSTTVYVGCRCVQVLELFEFNFGFANLRFVTITGNYIDWRNIKFLP